MPKKQKVERSEFLGKDMRLKGGGLGIPSFLSLLHQERIPRGFNILVAGPPGSGKSSFALSFIYDGLKEGEGGFLLSTDEPGYRIRDNMVSLGMDVVPYEGKGMFTLFDAYAGEYSSEQHMVLSPDSPRMLGYLIDKWWEGKKFNHFRWAIDSLTTLYSITDPEEMRAFLWDRVRKAKVVNATALYTITPKAHDEMTLTNIFNMMDMVIILTLEDTEEGLIKKLRVLKARRLRCDTRYYRFEIVPGEGIKILKEESWK